MEGYILQWMKKAHVEGERWNIQGRELRWRDFMKYAFSIVMCQDTSELYTKFIAQCRTPVNRFVSNFAWCWHYEILQFDSSLKDLDVYSKSQGYGKVELVQSFCLIVKLHETTQMFVMVDSVREITVKKSCKYGEYGSFKHLLFLCVVLFLFLLCFCFVFVLFLLCFVLFCLFVCLNGLVLVRLYSIVWIKQIKPEARCLPLSESEESEMLT